MRQQPLRMNGQPLKAGARRAAAAQEASSAAAGEAPAGETHLLSGLLWCEQGSAECLRSTTRQLEGEAGVI